MYIWRELLFIILGFTLFIGILYWVLVRAARLGNRIHQDPRFKRRVLFIAAIPYILGGLVGTVEVATGNEELKTLAGLAISIPMAWLFLWAARRTKIPPG